MVVMHNTILYIGPRLYRPQGRLKGAVRAMKDYSHVLSGGLAQQSALT
jgi:hypothetical protein